MICISINQESRRLALFDLFNAAPQCDLLEVRLDRFGMSPELGEFIANKPKPLIMSCRRKRDGGHWDGTEDERLALLRQAIVAKADYVEIELDVADQVRKFPPAKRVISYTNLKETPSDIADIYAEAQTKHPDVIKLTTLAQTPEEAWPLVQIVAKATVPTVVVGLGKPGVMLALLGRKIGAPWTYAALERGMEANPHQPTVSDLNTIYRYQEIEKTTRLIGVTGFGERDVATVSCFNAVLAHLELPARCLPMGVGSVKLFRRIIEAVRLAGVVVSDRHGESLRGMADEVNAAAEQAEAVDVVLHRGDRWHGYYTGTQAVVQALGERLKAKSGADDPLANRLVAVVGLDATAAALARELTKLCGSVILVSHDRKRAQELAQAIGCRQVAFEALYSTVHDVLIVCDHEADAVQSKSARPGVHPGYLKPGMTVADLTAELRPNEFLREAQMRGCAVVAPLDVLLAHLELQARLFTSKPIPRDVLRSGLPARLTEEE
jgi:3-dehydroquinate dehydratase/shikimate dehydrogenase